MKPLSIPTLIRNNLIPGLSLFLLFSLFSNAELRAQPYSYLVVIDSIYDNSDFELEEGVYDVDSLRSLDSTYLAGKPPRFNDFVSMLQLLDATAAEDLMPDYPDSPMPPDTLRGGIILSYDLLQRIYIITSDTLIDSTGLTDIVDSLPSFVGIEPVPKDTLDFWPPNDPLLNDQADYFSTNYNIDLPRAWEYSYGDPRVRVGIVDHGVDYMHPDLGGGIGPDNVVIGGYDFTDGDNDPRPKPFLFDNVEHFERHGTPIAGIIAANNNNNEGVVGIAGGYNHALSPGVSLLSYRTVDDSPSSRGDHLMSITYRGPLRAIERASSTDHANIINCSFGTEAPFFNFGVASKYQTYLKAFLEGTLVIVSRGNTGSNNKQYPARFSQAGILMAISGVNNNGNRATGSSFGNVSIAAPWDIGRTTLNSWQQNIYGSFNGNSNATPFVSGVAALVASSYVNQNIEYKPEDLMQVLQISADRTGVTGYTDDFGWGRLDAGQALHLSNQPFLLEHYIADGNTTISNDAPSPPPQNLTFHHFPTEEYEILYTKKVTATFTLPDKYVDLDSTWVWINSSTNGLPWDFPSWKVPGGIIESQNGRTWTFSTYVFNVRRPGTLFGSMWYPAAPEDVRINISVLGKVHNCEVSDITVQNKTINYYQYYTADNITVGPSTEVVLPGNAKFHASSSVRFVPGFHAHHLSRMHAFIEPLDCAQAKAVAGQYEKAKVETLQIFPNPSRHSITIGIPTMQGTHLSGKLEIYNQLGQVVKQVEISDVTDQSSHIAIDVSTLASGSYYVRLNLSNQQSFVERFAKLSQ